MQVSSSSGIPSPQSGPSSGTAQSNSDTSKSREYTSSAAVQHSGSPENACTQVLVGRSHESVVHMSPSSQSWFTLAVQHSDSRTYSQ